MHNRAPNLTRRFKFLCFLIPAGWQKYNVQAGAEIAPNRSVMVATMKRIKREGSNGWKIRISRLGGIVAALTIADAALFSYILSGYVVASRIVIPDGRVTTVARAYDASMKPSPQVAWTPARKQAKTAIPVIDASSVANSNTTNLNTSAENMSGAALEYRKVSTPAAVPQSEPAASLSRASKKSSTT